MAIDPDTMSIPVVQGGIEWIYFNKNMESKYGIGKLQCYGWRLN